jgi:catechol 2,3-dioxygenase-like lactoylglutathione lyase family enzyme
VLRVHHLAVVVADLARAEAFWADVLGLPVVRRSSDDAGRPRSVWCSLGDGAFVALERASAGGPKRADAAPGHHCVALGIAPEERAAWRARLAAAGVSIERESDFTLYVRDPDDNLVGLSHWPAAAG